MTEMNWQKWRLHFPKLAEQLNEHPEVRWDRFVVWENVTRIYGWIDREDGHADFVLADFYAAAVDDPSVVTSSPTFRWRDYIEGEHVDCERIEKWMPTVTNPVKLAQ
jgi:hypothetical protein